MEELLRDTLIKQHDKLREDVDAVLDILGTDKEIDFSKLYDALVKFRDDLNEHLELENGRFYPELLKEMQVADQDTSNIRRFIDDMQIMEKAIQSFMEKFESGNNDFKNDITKLKKEFSDIKEVLDMRMDLEEAKVF